MKMRAHRQTATLCDRDQRVSQTSDKPFLYFLCLKVPHILSLFLGKTAETN